MHEPRKHSQRWDQSDDFEETPEGEQYGAQHDDELKQMDDVPNFSRRRRRRRLLFFFFLVCLRKLLSEEKNQT